MPLTGYLALALGVAVLAVGAASSAAVSANTDPEMEWEARVAAGLGALTVGGPLLLVQVILTVLATRGDGPIWLWSWLVGAPLIGAVIVGPVLGPLRVGTTTSAGAGSGPPVAGSARRAADGRPPVDGAALAAAVRFAADQAWADFGETDGRWRLARSAPLPSAWPPPGNGAVVWLLYAERQDTPTTFEISAPWARLRLDPEATAPVVQRLADALAVIGIQASQPLSRHELGRLQPGLTAEAIRGAGPADDLAPGLEAWRRLNGTIASHPLVAEHLPPRRGGARL